MNLKSRIKQFIFRKIFKEERQKIAEMTSNRIALEILFLLDQLPPIPKDRKAVTFAEAVESKEVISRQGAALKVTRYQLSQKGKDALSGK